LLAITPQETEAGMAQLVFVDLETTGLDVERHGIIEIACIFETDGERQAAGLHSLVNPGAVEHTEAAAAVHNIPREAIDAAPPLLDVLRQFDSRCTDGAIVSGWNTKFDEAFLYRAYRQCGLPWRFDYHIFDVWSLYKHLQLIGTLPADLHLGLGTIARHFNMVRDGEDAHRATTDIEWTWRLYRLAIEQCPSTASPLPS
jgi:DNA polymerase III subunit epsilon